ncbi:MAG TPA: tail fiber domain-containing protein, partial [Chitinophagaceae bacterium]|nr:tail fiber domain-containing protein [Chitinophagaceae bacterium]
LNNSIGNTFLGSTSGQSNTSGFGNTFLGDATGINNVTGSFNIFAGRSAGYNNTASYNTALGAESFFSNTTGDKSAAIGFQCLYNNTVGINNVGFGYHSIYTNVTGSNNTASGVETLLNNTGDNNTADGYQAMLTNTSGSGNTAVGYHADVSAGDLNNATAIGNGALVNASNKIRLGNSSVTVIEGQVAYTFPSDGRFKTNVTESVKGLDFIMKLRPVIYNFQSRKYDAFIKGERVTDVKFASSVDYSESEKIIHTGFIAQEVEKAAQESGFQFDGVVAPKNDREAYGLSYSQFVVPLVKAVQEQQQQIEELRKQNQELLVRIEKLESRNPK